jgi:hypothetical protein
MNRDDINRMAREAGITVEITAGNPSFAQIEHFANLVAAAEREALPATFQKLRDESHTIQGASDDYKEGREMGVQLCINELTRGER